MLAPLTMIAILPTNRFTYPILAFSGTTLFSIGPTGATLRNWIPQTVLRYLPPALGYARWPTGAREVRRRGGAPITIPVPSTAATVQHAPAAK